MRKGLFGLIAIFRSKMKSIAHFNSFTTNFNGLNQNKP